MLEYPEEECAVIRILPTPFQFALSPQVHKNFKRTTEFWKKVAHIHGQTPDSLPQCYDYNPLAEDKKLWEAVVMTISTETPEGEALHLLFRNANPKLSEEEREAIERRFRLLFEEHKERWRGAR